MAVRRWVGNVSSDVNDPANWEPPGFFLYWTMGSCNEGDHSWGLSRHTSYGEALGEAYRLKAVDREAAWIIVEGTLVNESSLAVASR